MEGYEQRYAGVLQAGAEEPNGQEPGCYEVQEEENQHPPPVTGRRGRKKQNKSKNLLDRLEKYRAETLAFMGQVPALVEHFFDIGVTKFQR